jgi:predicted deacetylase
MCKEDGYFEEGFKAPNWQMTDLGYKVLKENGWWVAIRKHQIKDLPKGMKYYCFETNPNAVHGHTWLIPHILEEVKKWKKDNKFEFVSKNLKVK